MSNYAFDKLEIEEIAELSKTTSDSLKDIYTKVKSVKEKIEVHEGWEGKQKQELVAFLDLLIRYHDDLANKEHSPFSEYSKGYKTLNKNLEEYNDNSNSYRKMKTR